MYINRIIIKYQYNNNISYKLIIKYIIIELNIIVQ